MNYYLGYFQRYTALPNFFFGFQKKKYRFKKTTKFSKKNRFRKNDKIFKKKPISKNTSISNYFYQKLKNHAFYYSPFQEMLKMTDLKYFFSFLLLWIWPNQMQKMAFFSN